MRENIEANYRPPVRPVGGGLQLFWRQRKRARAKLQKREKVMELNRQQLESIIASNKSFFKYIEEETYQAPDGATIDLIQCAMKQDGDAWEDYELIQFIQEACQMFKAYSNRYVVA